MKKGFTLVELLGVIAILGVLIGLVTPSIERVISNSKETSYNTQIKKIEKATGDYLINNPRIVPEEGNKITIYLYTLKQEGLIDKDLKNPKTNKLFSNLTSVTILLQNGIYKYTISDSDLLDNSSDQDAPMIVLEGDIIEYVEVSQSKTYQVSSCSAINPDKTTTTCTYTIKDNATIDLTKKGTYQIVYEAINGTHKSSMVKTVIVQDTTSPIIKITNKTTILYYREVDKYMEKDYLSDLTVTDNSTDTLTNNKISITLKTNLAPFKGDYYIKYIAKDSSGNSSSYTRKVVVTDRIDIARLSMMKSYSTSVGYWQSAYKANINEITYYDTLDNVPKSCDYTNTTMCWDMTVNQNKKVIAWLENDTSISGQYKLYIAGEYGILFNTSASCYFAGMENVLNINNLKYAYTDLTTNMTQMFSYCSGLTSIDLTSFNTSNVTNMSYMFEHCSKLTTIDLTPLDTSKVITMAYMFFDCRGLTSLDLTSFNTSLVTNMSGMFYWCEKLTVLDLSCFDTSKVIDMSSMFSSCKKLVNLDLSNFNTSNVTNISYMFGYSGGGAIHTYDFLMSFEQITGIENFDTSNVTNMSGIFAHCKKLTSLNLSKWNTSKVTNMSKMFIECLELQTINLTGFNTSLVTDMSGMFNWCKKLTILDLSGFDTSSLLTTGSNSWNGGMFDSCILLTTIYVGSNWNMSNVTESTNMFYNCPKLLNFSSSYVDKTKAFAGTGGYLTLKV